MHKALYHRDDVDRLLVYRKQGGRGLASIEDTVDASIQRLEDYIEKQNRRRQGDPLGNVPEISIGRYKKMVYAQPDTCPRK